MKKILFIEDDPILGPVYETRLKAAGFEVVRATDGEAGMNALQMSRPDLVVLDLVLPRVSGLEILQILQESGASKKMPVLVFTNTFQEELLQKANKMGIRRVLSKSQFVPADVVAIIREELGDRSAPAKEKVVEIQHDPITAAQESVRKQAGGLLSSCRTLVGEISREKSKERQIPKLREMRKSVSQLTSLASSVALRAPAYFCEATEAFVGELCERPDELTVSSMRTVGQAVDFLFELFDESCKSVTTSGLQFHILVLDDEPLSRRAIQVALGRIKQHAKEFASSGQALEACANEPFDLAFVDVEMPDVDGYAFCEKLRKLETNRKTPVIFVTGHTDLQARAKSMLSGGNDFIGKPFHFMELAVKTLMHLLRNTLK